MSYQLSPVLDFLNLNASPFLEGDLERAIMDNLQGFLLELGRGFAFVARQQRILFSDTPESDFDRVVKQLEKSG